MSKSSSEATEKPGTGILRMARVNSNTISFSPDTAQSDF